MEIDVYSFEERRPLNMESIVLIRSSGKLEYCHVSYPSKTHPKKYCADFYELRYEGCSIPFGEQDLYLRTEDIKKILERRETKHCGYAT